MKSRRTMWRVRIETDETNAIFTALLHYAYSMYEPLLLL